MTLDLRLDAPLAELRVVSVAEANELLGAFGHKLGPVRRPPEYGLWAHALFSGGDPVAVAVTATLIRANVAGRPDLTRANSLELARLCAGRPSLSRAMLRLWREFVFPAFGRPHAISYQDAAQHRGDLYRFDGWARLGESRSGTDPRANGYRTRRRVIWGWNVPPAPAQLAA